MTLTVLFILLISIFTIEISSFDIIPYTGSGISNELKDQLSKSVINAYLKYNRVFCQASVIFITQELENKTNIKFSVRIQRNNPKDAGFLPLVKNDMYAIWPGFNSYQPQWTYMFFANGYKNDAMSNDSCGRPRTGLGLNYAKQQFIRSTIQNMETSNTCQQMGRQLGKILFSNDQQRWSSFCQQFSSDFNAVINSVSLKQQWFYGKNKRCSCWTWVSLY